MTSAANLLDDAPAGRGASRLCKQTHLIAFVLLVWTLYGAYCSVQIYFAYMASNRPVTIGTAVGSQFAAAYVWAAGTLWVVAACRRWRIERRNWKTRLSIHLVNCVIFVIVMGAAHAFIDILFFQNPPLQMREIARLALFMSDREILTYWCVAFMTHGYNYFWHSERGQLRAAVLENELAGARYDVLKSQVHPHFLFNALNAISTTIHEDRDVADRMVVNLGRFLRATLELHSAHVVTLAEELALVEAYLDIEMVRLQGRLAVKIEVAPDTLHAPVPCLLLQPLVENAIVHGIAPRQERGWLTVNARRLGNALLLNVANSRDAAARRRAGTGLGLTNVASRLQHLYDGAHALEIRSSDPHEFSVEIRVPLR